MKRIFIITLIFLCFCPYLFGTDLLPKHKEWLEIVKPILTATEREVFNRLKSDEERDKFIVFFWKQRDPRPDTEVNEFYQEYIERVRQADLLFSPGSGRRGSLTERGYFYLLLGAPLERHLFTTYSQLWPLELWFYQGDERYGLPPYFYLIFYQPQGQGDYRLFYPGVEGPETLLIPSLERQVFNREAAYKILRKISPELANASLSVIPGEKLLTATSLSSEAVLASIRSLPEKKFNEAYARNYLKYQGMVEVDYADSYVESNFRTNVFFHQGQTFLHWACEPTKMSFSTENEGQTFASYELYMKIEDEAERVIWERIEEIQVRLRKEEFESQGRRIFSFQDLLPIIAGKHKISFLLKNKTIKEFTSFFCEVIVPRPQEKISLSSPLIYFGREERNENQQSLLQAFCFGPRRYLVNARAEIPAGTRIGFIVQVFPSKNAWTKEGWLKLVIKRAEDGAVAKTAEQEIASIFQPENILDTGFFSLADLRPGYYYLDVSLLDKDRQVLATSQEKLILLSQAYPPVPRILSRVHPSFPSFENLKILGSQYFLAANYEEALKISQKILTFKDDPETKFLVAKSLFALGRFEESLALLLPLFEAKRSRELAKVIALNYVSLKKWAEALPYLEKLLQEATELSVLNLTAECYLNLGQPERALPLLQKSLQLEPNQPQVKKLEEAAKAKIK